MREEIAAGGVVFRSGDRGVEVLMIRDRFGCWTLPKGKVDPGEEPPRAALREIAEETGVAGEIRADLGTCRYTYLDEGSREVLKTVSYYLVEAVGGEPRANPGEVAEAGWRSLPEALACSDYPGNRAILEQAAEWLAARRR